MPMHLTPATPDTYDPSEAVGLRINRAPARTPEPVNPQELQQLLTAVRRAHKPGLCLQTIIAGCVATGSLMGIDYTQERDYAEPLLLSGQSVRILETA